MNRIILGASSLAFAVFSLSCGDSEPVEAPEGIALEIEYPAATALDAEIEATYGGCVAVVSPTHWHASWLGMTRRQSMDADGESMWRALSAVGAPGRYQMRIEDPNTCGRGGGEGADGSVFTNVISINGTRLTNKVLTESGEGPRQGFEFFVDAEGNVSN